MTQVGCWLMTTSELSGLLARVLQQEGFTETTAVHELERGVEEALVGALRHRPHPRRDAAACGAAVRKSARSESRAAQPAWRILMLTCPATVKSHRSLALTTTCPSPATPRELVAAPASHSRRAQGDDALGPR